MKKLEHLMVVLDHGVDRRLGRFLKFVLKHSAALGTIIVGTLFCWFLATLINKKPFYISSVIRSDLEKLGKIIDTINEECTIVSVRGDRVPLNFLTVQKFVGSVVGSLQLARPEKWNGPYLNVTPMLQRRCYDLIQTDEGVFLVPGEGVRLPNGYTVGRDFTLSRQSSIREMMRPGGYLHHRDAALAVEIKCKLATWQEGLPEGAVDRTQFEYLLEEFNQALPFGKRDEAAETAAPRAVRQV